MTILITIMMALGLIHNGEQFDRSQVRANINAINDYNTAHNSGLNIETDGIRVLVDDEEYE